MKYFQNGNLVSCSMIKLLKFGLKKRRIKNLNVQLSINDSYPLFTLFLLEDKNILKLYLIKYFKYLIIFYFFIFNYE